MVSFLSIIPVGNGQSSQVENGNISFMPNVIPQTSVSFSNSRFVFDWLGNHFEVAMFVDVEEVEYEVEVEAGKFKVKAKIGEVEYEFEAEGEVVVVKSASNIIWGLNVWDIPSLLANHTDSFMFKIVNATFGEEEIEVEEIDTYAQLGQNVTWLHLPDNLDVSYKDIVDYNYMVSYPSAFTAKVEGVKGKDKWLLDPITYSSPTMTVIGETGKGDTEANGYSGWDFWNASDANGWNVAKMFQTDNTTFEWGCVFKFGDDSTTTWVVAEAEHWTFNSTCISSDWQAPLITVENEGHLRLGKLIDPSTKRTENSVAILDNEDNLHHLIDSDANSELNFYGSLFIGNINNYCTLLINSDDTYKSEIYECLLDNVCLYSINPNLNITLYRITQKKGAYGIRYMSGVMNDVYLHSNAYALYWHGSYAPYTITSLKVRNCTKLMYVYSLGTDSYLINPNVDSWTFVWDGTSTAAVYRKYEHDFTFTYQNGTAYQGANVTITYEGQAGGTIGSWLTWANGSIPTQMLSRSFYNQTGGDTEYAYYPYVLTVTADGMDTYIQKWEPSQKELRQIALTPTSEAEYVWDFVTPLAFITPFALTFIVIGFLIKREREKHR